MTLENRVAALVATCMCSPDPLQYCENTTSFDSLTDAFTYAPPELRNELVLRTNIVSVVHFLLSVH